MSSDSPTRIQHVEAARSPLDVEEWHQGETVMGLYEVKGRLGEGGMGVVHRVRHRIWGIDLAVKSPRAEIMARPGGQESFIFEAENWVKLGLHPHIVSCYYVRMLDNIPRVFAEYVEGGDLHEWVSNERLYQGGHQEALKRIMDVSIQFAWGLHYAHSLGLIHQDVKPANVLVNNEGLVKVTDFGLSRAIVSVETRPEATQKITAGRTSPFTPAYASPEQTRNEPLTYRTDLFSWGVSVLEMFMGHPPNWGPLAQFVLDDYLENRLTAEPSVCPSIPDAVTDVLRWCFQEDPALRPSDFLEVANHMITIYEQVTGEPYARPSPDAAAQMADGLNNRAISLLDLGLAEEALQMLEAAVAADAHHPEAWYNRALVQWRTGRLTDEGALNAMRDMETAHGSTWEIKFNMAALHLERGDEGGARRLLTEANRMAPDYDTAANEAMHFLSKQLMPGLGYRTRLEGHGEAVLAVALSPSGDMVVTGSQDRTVRAWLPDSHDKACRVLKGHHAPVYAVTISPDGRFAYSGAEDGGLVVWDIQAGRVMAHMQGHKGAIWCLALAQNGQVTCSGGQDGTVRLWESATGRSVRTLQHNSPVTAVVINGNARMIVAGLDNGTCLVWDTSTSQVLRTLTGHTGPVRGLAIIGQGRAAVSVGTDGTMRIWNLERGECTTVLQGHRGAIESLSVQPEGRWAVTGGEDRTVRLWDLTMPRCWRTIETNAGRVYSVAVAGSKHRIAAANADRVADCWDFFPGTPVAHPQVVRPRRSEEILAVQSGYQAVLQTAYEALQRMDIPAAVAGLTEARQVEGFQRSPECLELWAWLAPYARHGSLLGTWPLSTLEGHQGRVNGVNCTPSGHRAVSVGDDGVLRLWDLQTLTSIGQWQAHSGPLAAVGMDAQARMAVVAVEDFIQVWDLEAGEVLHQLRGHRGPVLHVALDADGTHAASTAKDGTARVWNVLSGACVHSLQGQGESLHFRTDGRLLAWGSPGGTSRCFDLSTRQVVSTMRGHEDAVRSLSFNLDGSVLVTGSEDKTVRLWDVGTGKIRHVCKGHTRGVMAVAMIPDGRVAISASKDKSLIVWDVASGKALGTLVGHADVVSGVALSADGRLVLSACHDGTLRLWYLDWDLEPWDGEEQTIAAMPWIKDFRNRHMPYSPADPLTRLPPAHWNETDFQALFAELGYAGLAGLLPEYVHSALTQ